MAAEASELRGYDGFQRMHDDACDIGLAIISARTGVTERFYLEKRHDFEGETTHWEYRPENGQCPVRKVVVFND